MTDYRFPSPGVDARFPSVGEDRFFPSVGVDARFVDGKDLRFEDPGFDATLVLDLIATAALAAYSTRKVRSAYSGAALRVRRSSNNAEQDIGFAGNALDSAALLAFVGAGDGFVTAWYDQTGNGYHLTQAIATRQYGIVTAGVYLGRLFSDALSPRVLDITNAAFERSASPFTSCSAFDAVGVGGANVGSLVSLGASAGSRLIFGTNVGTRDLVVRAATGNTLASPTLTSPANGLVLGITKAATANVSAVSMRSNNSGPSGFTASALTAFSNIFAIGASAGANSCTHSIYETLFFGDALADTDLQTIARNQGAAFGIAVA